MDNKVVINVMTIISEELYIIFITKRRKRILCLLEDRNVLVSPFVALVLDQRKRESTVIPGERPRLVDFVPTGTDPSREEKEEETQGRREVEETASPVGRFSQESQ